MNSYYPKKGFLLSTPKKRLTKKSAFLKKLEAQQAELMHSAAQPHSAAVTRKLQLIEGYAERRK